MVVTPVFPVLLLAVVTRCKCDPLSQPQDNPVLTFGAFLKPPPPPQLAHLLPMPFHRGTERTQRQNADDGYNYHPPPLPPPQPSSAFQFPTPFYKQYNLNFLSSPIPFTSSTPASTTFEKVSNWLFPSQQTNYEASTIFNNNVAPKQRICNPCNLVPWLPIIRYGVGAKSIVQNSIPTYGPPSPTAYAVQKANKYPAPFKVNHDITTSQVKLPVPLQTNYDLAYQNLNKAIVAAVSSTYGPPSTFHSLETLTPKPLTSTYSEPSSTFNQPSNLYSPPSSEYKPPSTLYNTNNGRQQLPQTSSPTELTYGPPSAFHSLEALTPKPLTSTYSEPSSTFNQPSNLYTPPSSEYKPPSTLYNNNNGRQQLPQTSSPTELKNSYGEQLKISQLLDTSYPVSATAAETSKVKTQVLPNTSRSNVSFVLGNPAPFTLNRGRNIHRLQPVALPNLSILPLPPIFNARPFKPEASQFNSNNHLGINQMQQSVFNVDIQQSIPFVEYTHSIDYPATIVQSPLIDIPLPSLSNETEGYRNINNSYVVDQIKDISSQASEDHISSTKTVSDTSIEITGAGVGNDLYDIVLPLEMKPSFGTPANHKPYFADLRGLSDEDVDKYRTDNHLQSIDSPLLYLKPGAPHKSYGNFVLAISSPKPKNDFEMYDEIPTTIAPQQPAHSGNWDESRNGDIQKIVVPSSEKNNNSKPKVIQIIVPYTTSNTENENNKDYVEMARDWPSTPKNENQGRKIPDTDAATESITAETCVMVTENIENYDSGQFTTQKALYDVNDPPFDLIELQHTIDDWTVQEFGKKFNTPHKTRNNEIYAKKIPDDYFKTVPTTYIAATNESIYGLYDHDVSASVQHSITDDSENQIRKPYNTIQRYKNKQHSLKSEVDKLHIYTAASSFRKTRTTTPAPWGKIQTSISPLTKEKVYVVTSKPWKESRNISKEYDVEPYDKTIDANKPSDSSVHKSKSPRFLDRPSFGFSSGGKIESDSSAYTNSWSQSINELVYQADNNSKPLSENAN